jgi:hypothetical protein
MFGRLVVCSVGVLNYWSIHLRTSRCVCEQAKAIARDPGDIVGVVQKIANAIPQQATFFMTWVMLNVRAVTRLGLQPLCSCIGAASCACFVRRAATSAAGV